MNLLFHDKLSCIHIIKTHVSCSVSGDHQRVLPLKLGYGLGVIVDGEQTRFGEGVPYHYFVVITRSHDHAVFISFEFGNRSFVCFDGIATYTRIVPNANLVVHSYRHDALVVEERDPGDPLGVTITFGIKFSQKVPFLRSKRRIPWSWLPVTR